MWKLIVSIHSTNFKLWRRRSSMNYFKAHRKVSKNVSVVLALAMRQLAYKNAKSRSRTVILPHHSIPIFAELKREGGKEGGMKE